MKRVNVRGASFEEVRLFDKLAILTEERIDRDTLPKGMYSYELRGSDEDAGTPATLESDVSVNFCCTFVTNVSFDFDEAGYLDIKGELDFLGIETSFDAFMYRFVDNVMSFSAEGLLADLNVVMQSVGFDDLMRKYLHMFANESDASHSALSAHLFGEFRSKDAYSGHGFTLLMLMSILYESDLLYDFSLKGEDFTLENVYKFIEDNQYVDGLRDCKFALMDYDTFTDVYLDSLVDGADDVDSTLTMSKYSEFEFISLGTSSDSEENRDFIAVVDGSTIISVWIVAWGDKPHTVKIEMAQGWIMTDNYRIVTLPDVGLGVPNSIYISLAD